MGFEPASELLHWEATFVGARKVKPRVEGAGSVEGPPRVAGLLRTELGGEGPQIHARSGTARLELHPALVAVGEVVLPAAHAEQREAAGGVVERHGMKAFDPHAAESMPAGIGCTVGEMNDGEVELGVFFDAHRAGVHELLARSQRGVLVGPEILVSVWMIQQLGEPTEQFFVQRGGVVFARRGRVENGRHRRTRR